MSAELNASYGAWRQHAEAGEFDPVATGDALEGAEAAHHARTLLESIVGAEELDRAIGRGRPSLGRSRAVGTSPKRQVRLPHDLDERLVARARAEHRNLSDVMRDAIDAYLRAS